jgi:adenine-specific DNA-methyltransferase
MGTKRMLAPAVSDAVRQAQPGTMLDAFSGMCSVGAAIGDARQVWNNDAQIFASEVAKALFMSQTDPPSPLTCGDAHFRQFRSHSALLSRTFLHSLEVEKRLLSVTSFAALSRHTAELTNSLRRDIEACRIRSPHLFATTYSGTYFGIKQAIEADSIVASLHSARAKRDISRDDFRWGVLALGRTLLKVANSTGHFAQYLKPKPDNYRRYINLRQRSIWAEWLNSIAPFTPIGTPKWRKRNKVFNQDALSLIPRLARQNAEVSVIYADPPYTDDQYSRFYHVLETLCLYDYPAVSGAGLYRASRFRTLFSIKSEAPKALSNFIEACARTGADLVLSYPTNGIVNKAGSDVLGILRKNFKRAEIFHSLPHTHSTFGASKGVAQAAATELIYLARSA